MTLGIIYDSATDLGKKGVDAVYGHGMLNIHGMFDPIAIVDNPGDECEDVIIEQPPITKPGLGTGAGDGVWYDSRGHRHQRRCPAPEEPPVVIVDPPRDTCGDWGCGGESRNRSRRRSLV